MKAIIMHQREKRKNSGVIFSSAKQQIKSRKLQPGLEADIKKKKGTAEILHPTLNGGFERL
jgi:hypothetical protein